MLEKLKSSVKESREPSEQDQELEKQWATVFQLSNASTEQLALYRTQTLKKLNDNISQVVKLLRTIKKLMIGAVICLVIIALFV